MQKQMVLSGYINIEDMNMEIFTSHRQISSTNNKIIHYDLYVAVEYDDTKDKSSETYVLKPDDTILAIIESKKNKEDNIENYCYFSREYVQTHCGNDVCEDIYGDIKNKHKNAEIINVENNTLQEWYVTIINNETPTSKMEEYRKGNIPKDPDIESSGPRLFLEDLKKIEKEKERTEATKIFD